MKKKKFIIEFQKGEKLLILTMLFISIAIFGSHLNMTAVANNGGRMPVLDSWKYESDTHFTYQEPLQVKNWLLTDIFESRIGTFSIGDVMIVIGLLFVPIFIYFFCWKYYSSWKEYKKN